MPTSSRPDPNEWRLGIDLSHHATPHAEPPAGIETAPEEEIPDPSARRLNRPLYVLTTEHLTWLVVFIYAGLSRLLLLNQRPLSPAEARRALAALALSHTYLGTI